VDYVIVGVIGGLVGTGELISRYRDAPTAALLTVPAAIYVGVNAGASLSALALIHVFGWDFGQPAGSDTARWVQVLVAGFGAIALFRSSLFLVRVGDADVGVGPSSFLQILLSAADRAVDRKRANARAKAVADFMRDVSFDKAVTALPTYCLALMQNIPADEQENLASDVRELSQAPMADAVKTLNLGLLLMNVVGPATLQAALQSLGDTITFGDERPREPETDGVPAGTAEDALPPLPPAPAPAVDDS
jgi:hypothetical protein